jgi:hypothetical protein
MPHPTARKVCASQYALGGRGGMKKEAVTRGFVQLLRIWWTLTKDPKVAANGLLFRTKRGEIEGSYARIMDNIKVPVVEVECFLGHFFSLPFLCFPFSKQKTNNGRWRGR